MKVALFFGAGASAWAGYKTFLTFPGLFWPSGKNPSKLEVTEKESHLLSEMKIYLNKKDYPLTLDRYLCLINEYKNVTNLSVSHTIIRDRLHSTTLEWASLQELRELLITLRDRICKLTAEHYREPISKNSKEDIEKVYEFFNIIFEKTNQNHIELFTTNYDILPEYLFSNNEYFKKIRLEFLSEREKGDSKYKFIYDNNFEFFEEENDFNDSDRCIFKKPKNNEVNRAKTELGRKIYCTRLHGCVAWLHGDIGDEKIYFRLTKPFEIDNFYSKLCITYPGHEECFGRTPHKEAYERLAKICKEVDSIIFIGFSFRDEEIISVIGNSIWFRKRLPTFIVVDPQITKQEIIRRLYEARDKYAGPIPEWEELEKENIILIMKKFPNDELSSQIKDIIKEK